MIKVIPFKPGHLDFIKMRDCYYGDKELVESMDARSYSQSSYAYTFLVNSVVIAVVGGHFLWEGVFEVWAVTSDLISKHKLSFVRMGRKLLDAHARMFKIRRFHMYIGCDLPQRDGWPRLFGFEKEGRMKKYCRDGSDSWIYARVS